MRDVADRRCLSAVLTRGEAVNRARDPPQRALPLSFCGPAVLPFLLLGLVSEACLDMPRVCVVAAERAPPPLPGSCLYVHNSYVFRVSV